MRAILLFGRSFGRPFASSGIFTQMDSVHFSLSPLSVVLKWKFHRNIFHTPLSHDSYSEIIVHKYKCGNTLTRTHELSNGFTQVCASVHIKCTIIISNCSVNRNCGFEFKSNTELQPFDAAY